MPAKNSTVTHLSRSLLVLALAGAGLLLAGCGKKAADTTPVVAKVNADEITTQQLDYVEQQQLQQQGPRAASSPAAEAQLLERMIEQRLATQKAEKDKLDLNPGVVQALEAARREALARIYLEQVAEKVAKPTADELKKYYDSKPASFGDRRIYTLQKVDVALPRERFAEVGPRLKASRSAAEVLEILKSEKVQMNVNQSQQPAEALGPLLDRIAALPVGESVGVAQPAGLTVITVVATQPAPVSFEQARPQIEQMLLVERKREAVQAETKALREAAKIEYLGSFAKNTASAPARPATPASAAASH